MPQNVAAIQPPQPSSLTLEYLKAFGGVAYPLTALLVVIGVVFVVAAVGFGWFEINASLGKFSLKVQRPLRDRPETTITSPPAAAVEGKVEDQGAVGAYQEITAHSAAPAPNEEREQEPDLLKYFTARSLTELDSVHEAFMATVGPDDDEYWETDYRKRRASLGADNGRDAVRQLAADHPTWAYPYAVMVEWGLADHDPAAAEAHLAAGLTRQASPQFGDVLSAGVKLHHRLHGAVDATMFCTEWSKSAIPERMKAGAFYTLAELLREAGDIEGQRVALEWAVAIYPSDTRTSFALAYSYGESPGRWSSAMWHYRRLIRQKDDGIGRNNLGVLLGHFDKRVSIETYEKAAAKGDLYAVANMAHLLIADGYCKAAERLLEAVAEPGAAAELHGSAATAVLAARRTMSEREDKIMEAVSRESEAYRRSLSKALRHAQSGAPAAAGPYASADTLTVALVDGPRAVCRLRAGSSDFEGILAHQGTCYAGQMTSRGQSLLGSFSHQTTLLDEGGGTLRIFRWSNATGEACTCIETELHQVDVLPPPPPIVPTAPALPGNPLGLLALGQLKSN